MDIDYADYPWHMPINKGFDYSTINIEKLHALPVYKKPRTYHIADSMGAGNVGDPPGFPTHFLQHVYTQYGNSPRNVNYVLWCPKCKNYHKIPTIDSFTQGSYADKTGDYAGESNRFDPRYKRHKEFLHSLYIPVKKNSLRFKLWERSLYLHFYSCYYENSESVIKIGKNFKEIYSMYQDEKDELIRQSESHTAVHMIRRFYPDYEVNVEWAMYRPLPGRVRKEAEKQGIRLFTLGDGFEYDGKWIKHRHGDWWQRYADGPVQYEPLPIRS